MGSIRFDGVRFFAYPQDHDPCHDPCHVHGFYAEVEVIVELRQGDRFEVSLARRVNAIRPASARRSDVQHVLQVAAEHFSVLMKLWEEAHA